MMLLGCCRRRNCELIRVNGIISFNVAVVADTLYHLTVAVETYMGIVP
jgi:hypothetical protein